ncbi:xanthine dehydrogenase family protein molybdopterin-binding subunit [Falsiroseomonas sp.]|uniref:xanthine dehydrogenase family protein molybdopterin-binding subunit n=1 Tax=Falsiroseomonas sp. TaxID=2870721 RepID=UPI003F6FD0A2
MQQPAPNPNGIGQPIRRFEDARLLRGQGRYTDDLRAPDAAHAVFLRSPHAHARITAIDVTPALSLPGVIAVLTGQDAVADGIGTLPCAVPRQRPDGSPMPRPPYRPLAVGAAKHVGDPIALIVAETKQQARDAAEAVLVEWEVLPAVTSATVALAEGAAPVWPDLAPDNICFGFAQGDAAAVGAAFARAAHRVTLDFRISRVSANPMEPRAAIAEWDEAEGRWTLRNGTQGPHNLRDTLAPVLGAGSSALRVVAPDMGGAFGLRSHPTQEQAALLWAAKRLNRPLRWVADRSEALQSDAHARDNDSTVELALDAEGNFLALRIRTVANLGAYLALLTPHSSTNNLGGLAGVYRTPAIHAEVLGAFTNTQPTAPYRGAGRPEATYAIERVIDMAALHLGMDRAALRWKNLIQPTELPFRTGLVFTYDSGDFPRGMAMALEAADVAGFPARRAEAASRGMKLGLGIANAIEISAGPAKTPGEEGVEIRFGSDGHCTLLLGGHSHGQGHETAFRQMAATMLGLDPLKVRVAYGDTDALPHGRGTFGSRSIIAGGTAMTVASRRIIDRGRHIAGLMLEAAGADIDFADGRFTVAGTDRAVTIEQVARAAHVPGGLPQGEEKGFHATAIVAPQDATFPNGCHLCEAEVDPETGAVAITRYTVVDDVGTVVNPLLLKGQIQGGVAQGLGQALMEEAVFDAETGQLLAASFMDYAMPRAVDMPFVAVQSNPQPTPMNPLGAKGAGEAGTVGALPAIISAICDAIGVAHIDMPATPERVWKAMQSTLPSV